MAQRQQAGRVLMLTALTLALLADRAAAQATDPPRLTASLAAGMATALHSDMGFNAAEWQIALRTSVSRHVFLEGYFDQWRHSDQEEYSGGTIQSRTSVIGRYSKLTKQTVHVTRSIGVNALAAGSVGRVRLTAGGGPGVMIYQRRFSQTLLDCQSAAPESCQDNRNTWTSSGLSVQAAAGAEVALTSRLAAFGQFQFTAPIEDFAFSHMSTTAGIRATIW